MRGAAGQRPVVTFGLLDLDARTVPVALPANFDFSFDPARVPPARVTPTIGASTSPV